MRIATETGKVFSGKRAIEMSLPVSTVEELSALIKVLSPTQDTVFMRAYHKFDSGYQVNTSNHNGVLISANSPEPAAGIHPPVFSADAISFKKLVGSASYRQHKAVFDAKSEPTRRCRPER